MKTFKSVLTATVFGCVLASSLAFAQYEGPGASQSKYTPTTVQAILADPKDDQHVSLQGYLVEKTAHEKYRFRDSTSDIIVEIDDDDLPSFTFDATTLVEIRGEVDTHWRKAPDIDVDSVHKL